MPLQANPCRFDDLRATSTACALHREGPGEVIPDGLVNRCDELHLSEGEASAFLAMLTHEGRVRIREVELVS